jgi:hypothetical protein
VVTVVTDRGDRWQYNESDESDWSGDKWWERGEQRQRTVKFII